MLDSCAYCTEGDRAYCVLQEGRREAVVPALHCIVHCTEPSSGAGQHCTTDRLVAARAGAAVRPGEAGGWHQLSERRGPRELGRGAGREPPPVGGRVYIQTVFVSGTAVLSRP
jgi:hypothetical protein